MDKIIFSCYIFSAFVLGITIGIIFSNLSEVDDSLKKPIGCWKLISETNRSMIIQVNNQKIEEIIDTARHEICHEIDYRRNGNTVMHDEDFAENCNPEEFISKF